MRWSSNVSNQMPPQPPWQTSTVTLPTCNGASSLKHAGHFIIGLSSAVEALGN
jgi:hypothetical protein